MAKKINIGSKPDRRRAELTQAADAWVNAPTTELTTPAIQLREAATSNSGQGEGGSVATTIKRLTLDLSASLHRRIKTSCANRGTSMVEEIRELLESSYPEEPKK